jgi:hypothetical protein
MATNGIHRCNRCEREMQPHIASGLPMCPVCDYTSTWSSTTEIIKDPIAEQRRKLWSEVYVEKLSQSGSANAKMEADKAVRIFNETFEEEGED